MRGREPARIFVSYAEEDAAFFEAFQKHLAVLKRRGLVDVWHPGRIDPGAAVDDRERALIDQATVVVLLVSASFLHSDRHWEKHLGRALERRARRELTVVPIVVRAVVLDGAPFHGLQPLPRDGTPIGEAKNDVAWKGVVEELASILSARPAADELEPAYRGSRERPDDFPTRVAKLCHLKENRKPLSRCLAPEPLCGLWEVETSRWPVVVKPIAALDAAPTEAVVADFDKLLDARYRGEFPHVQAMLVHPGESAPEELIRAALRRGILLTPYHALNEPFDFDAYLKHLRGKLRTDPAYPLDIYVPQRGQHVVGRQVRPVNNALEDLWRVIVNPEHPVFMLVLADFGTGKTFLLRQLAARLSEPKSPVRPVLIELRALEKARKLDALLMQHFAVEDQRLVDLDGFYHMLEQGQVALLFDGFDELVPRVTFDRAAEHLETLMEAARGRAKVIITSRTQHFLADRDVEQALARKAEQVPHRRLFKLLPFNSSEIRAFLVQKLGGEEAADRRFALLRQVTDLLGLSHNPRMLSFIVEIEEEKLLAARDRVGKITKAELYTLLVERWIRHEFKRSEYRGVPTLLDAPARWWAVLRFAEELWSMDDRFLDLRQLPKSLQEELRRIGPPDPELPDKLQPFGSGTLLVRDDEGRFSFLHRSILEFAAAWAAAAALGAGKLDARLLAASEMTDLMAEFFGDLATPEKALSWARDVLQGEGTPLAKKNAQRVIQQAPAEARKAFFPPRVVRRGENLRGESFAGQDLRNADFSGADLSEAVLANANLAGALLVGVKLLYADLRGADLTGANLERADLTFARLDGARLRQARLDGVVWRYARLLGVQADAGALEGALTVGACPALPNHAHPITSQASKVLCVTVSPDGALVASGHSGGALVLWNLRTGEALRVWGAHEDDVRSVAFSPDGTTLASGSDDNTARLWRVSDGAPLRSLQAHFKYVLSVAFSPDGTTLASGSWDTTVRLWRVSDGALLRSLEAHSNYVNSVAFSPDGTTLASGSGDTTVRLWRVSDGALLRALPGHSNSVQTVAFSPDGTILVSGSADHTVRLWRVSDGAPLRALPGHSNFVLSVAFSPAGTVLATGSLDNTVRLWRVSDGASLRSLQAHFLPVQSVAFSPDGTTLASGSVDRTVQLWRVSDGALLRSLQAHSNSVNSVAFSPDGTTLASGSGDTIVRLWRVSDGAPLRSLQAHSYSVLSVAFSPDGTTLASGSWDNTVRLWRVSDGAPLRSLQAHFLPVQSVAFSPDGTTLASGSWDNTVRLWRVSDGAPLRSLQAHSQSVISVAFSPDGTTLASGSGDNTVRLWRVSDGAPLRSLQVHFSSVLSVAFSPDSTTLASASRDNTVRLWRVADGRCLAVLFATETGWVAFTPDGRYKLGGDLQGSFWHVIGLCRFEPGELDEALPGLRMRDDERLLPPPP